MISMLDCIKRIPSILDAILAKADETFASFWETYGERVGTIDEIMLIGSGSSNTSAMTSRFMLEKASGLRVTIMVPSDFLYHHTARNPNALYVFISQTGTSSLTRKALQLVKAAGWRAAAISESATTPIAREAEVFIDMGCGHEEYSMRTIGYSSTVLTAMLLGMQIGRGRGFLSSRAYDEHMSNARAAAGNIPAMIDASMAWLDKNRRGMLRSDCIIFTGSGALHGVALEGAVKVWETPQITSIGYELEEGIHGPNFGYTHNHCVIVLNDGGVEDQKARALGRYMKLEKNNGLIVGAGTLDQQDLPFEPRGKDFCCLEFSAVVQVLAYRLAYDQGRDLFAPHDNSVMNSYFRSHDEPGAA